MDTAAECGRILYFSVPDDPFHPLDPESTIRKHNTLMSGGTMERGDRWRRPTPTCESILG